MNKSSFTHSVGIIITNAAGSIIHVDDGLCGIFKGKKKGFLDKNIATLFIDDINVPGNPSGNEFIAKDLKGDFFSIYLNISRYSEASEPRLVYTLTTIEDNETEEQEAGIYERELFHRVKNNLNMISNMLRFDLLQIDKSNPAYATIQKGIESIKSLSLLYDQLNLNPADRSKKNNVMVHTFIRDMFHNLDNALKIQEKVECILEIDTDVILSSDVAMSIGFIFNELITNSLKYAFGASVANPRITFQLNRKDDNLELNYYDNGKGLSSNRVVNDSLGYGIINALVQKFDGDIHYPDSGLGFAISISFKEQFDNSYKPISS